MNRPGKSLATAAALLLTVGILSPEFSGQESAPKDDDFGTKPKPSAEQKDDDFGAKPRPKPPAEPKDDGFRVKPKSPAEPKDDDFGAKPKMPATGAKDDDFGNSLMPEDDDFGSAEKKMDDTFDFGEDAPAGEAPENDLDEKQDKKRFASATEAHLTFLKALESEKRFPSAATCAECHPDHYREWSVSAHAYSQLSPVFNTMHAAIVSRTAGTNGDFCIRCHTQVGMQRDEPLFTSNLKRHPASVEGITCIVCHRVDKNYGKVSGRTHINQGSIFEPVYGPAGNKILKETLQREDLAKKLNPNPPVEGEEARVGKKDIHGDIKKFDPISTSGFCGTCHDVNLYNGFRLEEAFSQFKNSPAAAKGESCQDCHMGKIPGAVAPGIIKKEEPDHFAVANYLRGAGARIGGDIWAEKDDEGSGTWGIDTPERKRTNHMFAGPDYSIVHPALFPHSEDLRQAMWEYIREIPDSDKHERVGMKHLLEFQWEAGWGDPESGFEKAIIKNPDLEKKLPWPWSDSIARLTLREKLNDNFRLLNEINVQRHQILRRALQFNDFEIKRNDANGIEFAVEVVNKTDGHGVPTGFDAERLMFLQATVKDRFGRIVFQSGDRDPNGDVRDLHSAFVHHHAKKTGSWLAATDWKEAAGLSRRKEDLTWLLDEHLFTLQSKFLTRNHRGGEREQILAVNYSVDPLPYIRPDTRPGILLARPAGARKQARGLPPLGSRWARYRVDEDQLTGKGPYTVNLRFICQMVPVNLIKEISDQGFDYNLSPREVGKRVAFGHRVSKSTEDEDRRGGSLAIWDQTLTLHESGWKTNLAPAEKEIMAAPGDPFPFKDPDIFGAIGGIDGGGIEIPYVPVPDAEMPKKPGESLKPNPLIPKPKPKPSEGSEDDSFE